MDKHIRSALLSLGCDSKEIQLFMACFAHGSGSLTDLAKKARLRRSTAYLIASSLVDKGLLTEDSKAYGKSYTAIEPEGLIRLVAGRKRQIGRQQLALEENLHELQAQYQANEIRPRVKTYQGPNGLVNVWRDILTAKGEILIWTNQATESKLFNTAQHNQFIIERRERGNAARVLAVDNPAGKELQAADSENLRETRLLTPDITFSPETYIYDHKVATLDYNHDIIGIIIESQSITAAQRAAFEATWQKL